MNHRGPYRFWLLAQTVQNFNLNPDASSCWPFWVVAAEPAFPFAVSMAGDCEKKSGSPPRQPSSPRRLHPRVLYRRRLAVISKNGIP